MMTNLIPISQNAPHFFPKRFADNGSKTGLKFVLKHGELTPPPIQVITSLIHMECGLMEIGVSRATKTVHGQTKSK